MYIIGSGGGWSHEGFTYGINIEDKQLPDVFAVALRMRVVANGKAKLIKFVSLQLENCASVMRNT